MKRQFLMLSGVTKRERNQVIADVSSVVASCSGWIVNHTLFSNMAITLQAELPVQSLLDFKEKILVSQVDLFEDGLQKLEATTAKQSQDTQDINISLNITFIHEEPDMRRTIAAVPG